MTISKKRLSSRRSKLRRLQHTSDQKFGKIVLIQPFNQHDPNDKTSGVHDNFRSAMRRHAASVCVVTVPGDEDLNGMTITAATSFSMDPPAVLICVNKAASVTSRLQLEQQFGLTLLAGDQEDIAAAFAKSPSGPQRFAHGEWLQTQTSPCLVGAASNLSCTVVETIAYGSHVAVIGSVDEVQIGSTGQGLLYCDGIYERLSSRAIQI